MTNEFVKFKNQMTTALLSSPIVYVPHFHHKLIDDALTGIIAPSQGRCVVEGLSFDDLVEFDCGQNRVLDFKTKALDTYMASNNNLVQLLKDVATCKGFPASRPVVVLLKNFSTYLQQPEVQSMLALFAAQYERQRVHALSTVIIVSQQPVSMLPPEVSRYFSVIQPAAPSEEEIMQLLSRWPVSARHINEEAEMRRDLCRTLQGLQMYEIRQIMRSALTRTGEHISAITKQLALEEKKNIVRKSGIIEVVDTDVNFSQVGGLSVLKYDLERKGNIFKHLSLAQENHVPLPKGVLIIGMPGCGKSMIAKSIAHEFGVSLLRLDINRLMGMYVGQSEANLRQALATAEAAHPCVLWIDEIEKAFHGSNGQQSDMLVMRLMGHFLTWMQERRTPVFIVATANDVMRPEFMRKGRFDEVYFVDFPTHKERIQILRKKLERFTEVPDSIFDFSDLTDYGLLVDGMKGHYGGFSGAEIESVVNMVVERKFMDYVNKLKESGGERPPKEKITKNDFALAVQAIQPAVMANQVSNPNNNSGDQKPEPTNIERILKMQETYHFKRASRK